ncbi:uncharacterized protein M437DRAFT_36590 [Aureobasidium melanogenum CBS 110374]|uniref:Stress response protein ish1 n=1 Tax=Aureobasidium melanogenum (strain CBS 110374) TaxID=1043003 RepID=A0A074W1T1_AURM1|nr:uncharacterized protein M437DRAFT_36590 [Aureobasidium melanogenum CBS 110374]KEQ67060.1 hypothetical protein M437DRAFT_36590 [Aureobasidium melanogenum CBS 110374]
MRFNFATAAVLALGAQSVTASTWFSKAAYNKWHETELERWLSDHDVPYPTPADRKDLVDLVKNNWNDKVAQPYNTWDTNQLQNYITSSGQQVKKGTEQNKDSLVSQVKSYWHETADQASDAYASVQDWVFDSWTDSQLKAFLDYHSIPNPSPRSRDTLLHSARSNYQSVAKKAGETTAYPGNWLYSSWADSDLKSWLDERGIPVPQPSSRDKMIAALRRNARTAANQASKAAASASASAAGAQQSLSEQLLNSWSDSQLKQWFDKNGIKVPQGSKRNELIALARKHSAKLSGDNSASSLSGAAAQSAHSATNAAGSQFASATDTVYGSAQYWFDWAKAQVGIGGEEAKASLASISSVASASASSLSSVASVSGSSGYNAATDAAAASASSASSVAGDYANDAYDAAAASGKSATDAAGKSASSLSGAAAKSASSASSAASVAASKSSSSLSSAAAKSASSVSASGPKSASSAASSASKGAAGYAQQAADAVNEGASSAKHKASEAAQKATDRVKEEL